tara:strand:- start:4192 stop:5463 length:1272 start_codon:yes stop_codon:yes gene_type:complete
MASTYTTNLRLTKQGDGENPNSWGQILNDGVISLADQAIAGYDSVSIGSAASVALTANSGADDQSRNAFLELTGSIGTAATSIFVLIPNNSKSYVVHNSVSYNNSSDVVMVRVAGNTGVTIPSGESKYIFTDGATVRGIQQDTFGNITVTGSATFNSTVKLDSTVTVSGNSTFKGQVSTNSDMAVGGAIAVSGNSTFSGTQTFVGAAQFQSTVTVSGNATFSSNVTIKGNVHVSSKVCASAFFGDGSNITGITAVPTGGVLPFAGGSAPSGFLLCDGSAVSRSTYSDLFTAISTTYGVGDGSSTFNIPDLRGRVVAGQDDMGGTSANRLTGQTGGVDGDNLGEAGGAETHALTEAQLAAHTHGPGTFVINTGGDAAQASDNGAVFRQTIQRTTPVSGASGSTGSDSAHNNVQPTLILNYIIKT